MDTYILILRGLFIVISLQGMTSADHYNWGRRQVKTDVSEDPYSDTQINLGQGYKNVGQPLILTQYIKRNQIQSARTLSKVKPQIDEWPSYSGYFTVNEECDSNLFFWFIPALNNWETAPVLLWLQGGPGAGSLFGLFEEIGPFNLFPMGLEPRNYTWNNDNNIIYIDQPAGSGYSFSTKKCYAENMTRVTEELYSALVQFFQVFSELQSNKFFITGESFAGHYIPALAIYIHKQNPKAAVRINLAGVLIGNPLIKLSCHDYATFLFEWGIIDKNMRDKVIERQKILIEHANNQQYKEAWDDWQYVLNDLIGDKLYLQNKECMIQTPPDQSDYIGWITTPVLRRQLHVGSTEYNDINLEVYDKLVKTIAQPMTSEIEQLLETKNYIVGFYSGNLDMVCMTTSTECSLDGLQWWGSQKYLAAEIKHFKLYGDSLVGWVKLAGPLFLVVVRDAGHSVPIYQPAVMYQLISKLTTASPGVNPALSLVQP